MDGRVEWIYLTGNNIIRNFNVDGYDLVIPKYPIFVNEFGKQEEYNQVVTHNLMPGGDGSLIVTNFQHMSEPYPIESFRYIPNKNEPTSGRWVSNWEGATNQPAENTFIHIKYLRPSVYGILKDGVVVAHEVTQTATPSIPTQAARKPDPEPDFELDEANEFQRKIKKSANTKARSESPPPSPVMSRASNPLMDRAGKKSGCEGPGCAVMGGKKKTRRHKSRKQKKSKSKKHKKSKSKRHTRGRK